MRTTHATGQVRPMVEHITSRVWEEVAELDDAFTAIAGRALRTRRRREHR